MKIAVIIPIYNEGKTIIGLINKCLKYTDYLIIINDASTDIPSQSLNISKKIILINNLSNQGLGSSIRKGFKKALQLPVDIILSMDGDGQHKPEDIPGFIEKIKQGYGFVIGKRDFKGYPLSKRIGNKLLTFLTNTISSTKFSDTESGFRAYTKETIKRLNLEAERYQICAEIIKEIGKNKIKSAEIPIQIPYYIKGTTIVDGISNFWFILKNG